MVIGYKVEEEKEWEAKSAKVKVKLRRVGAGQECKDLKKKIEVPYAYCGQSSSSR